MKLRAHAPTTRSQGSAAIAGAAALKRGGRAALLLEVLVALTILVTAMGLLAAQLVNGLNMTDYAERQFRAGLLADRVLALVQLDPALKRLMNESEEFEFEFTDENPLGYPLADMPGYFWRVRHEPVNREEQDKLRLVRIQVLRQREDASLASKGDAEVVRELAFLRAAPATVNLVAEAGLSEDAAAQLQSAIPLGGFDPHAVDFQELMAALDRDTLALLMPLLQPLLGRLAGGRLPAGMAGLGDQLGPGGQFGRRGGGAEGLPDETQAGDVNAAELEALIRAAVEAAGQMPQTTPPPSGPPPRRPPGLPDGGFGRQDETGDIAPPRPAPSGPPVIDIGRGSGPNGEYTLEDLMRLRDAYERAQQEQGGL